MPGPCSSCSTLTTDCVPADAALQAGPGEDGEPGGGADHADPPRLHPGHHAVLHLPAVQLDLHHDVAHVDQLGPVQLQDGEGGGAEVVILKPGQADIRDHGGKTDRGHNFPLLLLLLLLAVFACLCVLFAFPLILLLLLYYLIRLVLIICQDILISPTIL